MKNNSLKEEFIHLVRGNEMADQPAPNKVYFDTDLEELVIDELKASFTFEDSKFIITRGGEKVEFKSEEVENRHDHKNIEETLITLS